MQTRLFRLYGYSTAALLLLTAAAKLYSASGTVRILTATDPLLHLNYRHIMVAVGLLEAGIAVYLLKGHNVMAKTWLIFWLSSNFILYRFGNAFLRVKLCPCLGTVADTLPVTKAQVDFLLLATVLYMFFGSSYFLLREWNQRLVEQAKNAEIGVRREEIAAAGQS